MQPTTQPASQPFTHETTPEEHDYLSHLQEKFSAHTDTYLARKKDELARGLGQKLTQERTRLREYLDGVSAGLVTDHTIRMNFRHAKLRILDELLAPTQPPASDQTHILKREHLRALSRACTYLYPHEANSVRDTIAFADRLTSTLADPEGKRITSIKIFISFSHDSATDAYFNDHSARLASTTVRAYTLKRTSAGTILAGIPPLTTAQQHHILHKLSTHLLSYR